MDERTGQLPPLSARAILEQNRSVGLLLDGEPRAELQGEVVAGRGLSRVQHDLLFKAVALGGVGDVHALQDPRVAGCGTLHLGSRFPNRSRRRPLGGGRAVAWLGGFAIGVRLRREQAHLDRLALPGNRGRTAAEDLRKGDLDLVGGVAQRAAGGGHQRAVDPLPLAFSVLEVHRGAEDLGLEHPMLADYGSGGLRAPLGELLPDLAVG
ncbi:MAG: hypothetical protein ACT4OM_05530 [Actinomycetota bacterium]